MLVDDDDDGILCGREKKEGKVRRTKERETNVTVRDRWKSNLPLLDAFADPFMCCA